MKSKCGAAILLMLVLVMACAGALADYNVTFNANNTIVPDPSNPSTTITISVSKMPNPSTVSVPAGAKVVQPENPSATGYTFDGWYKEEACTTQYDFTTKVTADLTLYAKWTPITYTVKFDLQDTSITTTIPNQTVNHGATVTEPAAPTKVGYTFGGWYKEPTCATEFKFTNGQSNETVTSNITLYAKWSINQYSVTFNNQGHGIQPPQQMVNHGDKARNPGDLVEQGYRFEGWYTDLNNENTRYNFTESVTGHVTLHAKWTTLHTVTFNLNGHGAVIKPMTVDDGGTVTAPATPTAEGYAFVEWVWKKDENNPTLVKFNFADDTNPDTVTRNFELVAKWTATVTVRFQWQKAITNSGSAPTDPAEVQLMIDGREALDTDEGVVQAQKTLLPGNAAEPLWTGLPDGHIYTVAAVGVPENYTAVCTQTGENTFLITYVENEKLSVSITNTHVADTIDMVISKYWDDNNNQHRPGSIQVQVMKVENGVKKPVKDKNDNDIVLTLNDSNQWTAHVTDLYMRENGTTIQYIIEEVGDVKGYKATCEIVVDAQGNYTVRVTNVLTGKVDISGEKVWEDDNDRDGIRPQSVQLKIYENSISSSTLVKNVIVDKNGTGSTANSWKWTVEDLPVYDEFGRSITYIVVEDPVPDGYTASAPAYITVGTTP